MRVVILKDRYSPLYYLRCATPCGGDRCTLRGDHCSTGRLPKRLQGVCWLGSSTSPEGCQVLATRWGYQVVEPPPEASPAP